MDVKIFYIRYHARRKPATFVPLSRDGMSGGYDRTSSPRFNSLLEPPDEREPLLKPLHPRVFGVYDPEQFRRALADLMQELKRL